MRKRAVLSKAVLILLLLVLIQESHAAKFGGEVTQTYDGSQASEITPETPIADKNGGFLQDTFDKKLDSGKLTTDDIKTVINMENINSPEQVKSMKGNIAKLMNHPKYGAETRQLLSDHIFQKTGSRVDFGTEPLKGVEVEYWQGKLSGVSFELDGKRIVITQTILAQTGATLRFRQLNGETIMEAKTQSGQWAKPTYNQIKEWAAKTPNIEVIQRMENGKPKMIFVARNTVGSTTRINPRVEPGLSMTFSNNFGTYTVYNFGYAEMMDDNITIDYAKAFNSSNINGTGLDGISAHPDIFSSPTGTAPNPARIGLAQELLIRTPDRTLRTFLANATNITISATNAWEATSANKIVIQTPTTTLSMKNVTNIHFVDGNLTIAHANVITSTDGWLSTDTEKYKGNFTKFWVESAETVMANGLVNTGAKNTTFTIMGNVTRLDPELEIEATLMDAAFLDSTFKAGENGSLVYIPLHTYILTRGNMTINHADYTETIFANNTAILNATLFHGIICASMKPNAAYMYNHNDTRVDFALAIPTYSTQYTLCLRKSPEQSFPQAKLDYTLVDFVDKKLFLNSYVNYLRYYMQDNTLASLTLKHTYLGLSDSKTTMQLDQSFLKITDMTIERNATLNSTKQQEVKTKVSSNLLNITNTTLTVTIPNDYYKIKEEYGGYEDFNSHEKRNETHTMIQLNPKLTRSTDTIILVYDENTTLYQNNLHMEKLDILCPQDPQKIQVLTHQKTRYTLQDPRSIISAAAYGYEFTYALG